MTLRELQSKFSDAIRLGCEAPETVAWLKKSPPISNARRLEIYQYAYRARIEESLAEDFPLTRKQMGKTAFSKAVTDYLIASPSTYSSLAEVSGPFPEFLRRQCPSTVPRATAELARFEWLKILSLLTDQVPHSNLGQLPTLSPKQWLQVVFEFHPSVIKFESSCSVPHVLKEGGKPPTRLMIRCQNGNLFFRRMGPLKWGLFDAIHRGATVRELSKGISPRTLEALGHWSQSGIIYSYRLKTK